MYTVYIYGTLPPMYPHFCVVHTKLGGEDMFHVLVSDVQGGYHIYCLSSWGQVLLPTSEGQESFKKGSKVLKLLGTKN